MEEVYGEERRAQMLDLLKDRQESTEAAQEFKFIYKRSNDKVCLTIPSSVKAADMVAYSWDNANTTGGSFEEYENFRVYDNDFEYITANKDINNGIWSTQYKCFRKHSEDEFITELKRIYFILLALNSKRYGDDKEKSKHTIDIFFRKILIHLNEYSKYGFNRLYVISQLDNWTYLYNRTKKTEIESLVNVLGVKGNIVRKRDYKLKSDSVIVEVEGEHNSFHSRLSEDRKRHSVKKFISDNKLSSLTEGYLLPITSDDLNICKHSHKELKKLVNSYNEELTGGTYKGHLSTYCIVAEYVSLCYVNFLVNEKTCKSRNTPYIDTYIGCTQIYTQFIESNYFPKVSDVSRELNIDNRRGIKTALTSLKKQNITKIVADAETLIIVAEGYGFELNNINTNGKNRLNIILKEYSKEDLRRELKSKELHSNLNLPNITTKEAFDDEPID